MDLMFSKISSVVGEGPLIVIKFFNVLVPEIFKNNFLTASVRKLTNFY